MASGWFEWTEARAMGRLRFRELADLHDPVLGLDGEEARYRLKPPRSQAPVAAFHDPGASTDASDTWPAHGLKRAWPRDVWGFKSMDRTGTLESSP